MKIIKESKLGERIVGEKQYGKLRTGLKKDLIALTNKRGEYDAFSFENMTERLTEVSDFLSKLEASVRKKPLDKNGK